MVQPCHDNVVFVFTPYAYHNKFLTGVLSSVWHGIWWYFSLPLKQSNLCKFIDYSGLRYDFIFTCAFWNIFRLFIQELKYLSVRRCRNKLWRCRKKLPVTEYYSRIRADPRWGITFGLLLPAPHQISPPTQSKSFLENVFVKGGVDWFLAKLFICFFGKEILELTGFWKKMIGCRK